MKITDINKTFWANACAKTWEYIDRDIRYLVGEVVWLRADGRVWWRQVGRHEVDQLKEDYHED